MIGSYEVIPADYCRESSIATRHRDNPLIAALPLSGMKIEEIMKRFSNLPPLPTAADRRLHRLERFAQLNTLDDIIYNRVDYFHAVMSAVTCIRETYVARNHITAEDRRRRHLLHSHNNTIDTIPIPANWKSTARSLGFFGLSGSGKTTFANLLGLPYMVVIRHTNYKGTPMKLDQIPWIYIQIPHDATVKSLCLQFFRKVDDILGYSDYHNQAIAVTGIAQMVMLIARVATTVALAALFVDEVHNLKVAKGPNVVIVLNLFSQLVELAGISVFVAGTPGVKSIVEPGTANQRKLITGGEVSFKLMPEKSAEFEDFTDTYWRYQYVQKPGRLTPAIRKAWHAAGAGNPAFTVLVFLLAQRNEIGLRETVDEVSLTMAAHDNMALLQPTIRALRLGTSAALQSADDLMTQAALKTIRESMGLPGPAAQAYAMADDGELDGVEPQAAAKSARGNNAGRKGKAAKGPDPLPSSERPLLKF